MSNNVKKSAFIDIDGVKINYQRQGDVGPTLVLLHGNSGCKEVFEHQFSYFKSGRFSVLALDLPGHGKSANAVHPQTDYTIPGYAWLVDRVLAQLNVDDYILVGWSLGGNIALEMAGCGTSAKGLMIFGAPPIGPGMENIEKAYTPETFDTAAGESQTPTEQLDAFVQAIYGTLDPIPSEFFACAHRTDAISREIMMSHWMGGGDGHRQYDTIAKWGKPICVAHGNLDPFVMLDYLQTAPWDNLWRGKVFEFANCGHAPFLEDPTDFNAVLEEFAEHVL
jgi:pimeloyl-ACP methyl ester carboxylesterase